MIIGLDGTFVPEEGGDHCVAAEDNFSTVNLPDNVDHVVFVASTAAVITEFLLKVEGICSDGGALTVSVDFYNQDWGTQPVSTFFVSVPFTRH